MGSSTADVLVEALPYIEAFAGSTILVKIGGELVDDPVGVAKVSQDVRLLHSIGLRVVLCHGGGPQISRAMNAVGKEPEFRDGLRVTDHETLEVTAGVLLGEINRTLVTVLNRSGATAIGISGLDGRLLRTRMADTRLGLVGEIDRVDPRPVLSILAAGYVPVVAPLGLDDEGVVHNVNADIAAGALAVALDAKRYVVLTNVAGLYADVTDLDSMISEIDLDGLGALRASGCVSSGMMPKLDSIETALRGGVEAAHILDGTEPHSMLLELFTRFGVGTKISRGTEGS